jgi:hypothetical protein
MSRERANQKVRDGEFDLIAVVKVTAEAVKKLTVDFKGTTYVPIDDLKVLIDKTAKELVSFASDPGVDYAYGAESKVVQNILCSILRVPKVNARNAKSNRAHHSAASEADKHEDQHKEAAGISKIFRPGGSSTSSYEDYEKAVRDSSSPEKIKRLLLINSKESATLKLPSGEDLPPIIPAPKCLNTTSRIKVRLKVYAVHDTDYRATVLLTSAESDGGASQALEPFIDHLLPMTIPRNETAIRKVLLSMQLLGHPVTCHVYATVALRPADRRLTLLSFVDFDDLKSHTDTAVSGLRQMSLDF